MKRAEIMKTYKIYIGGKFPRTESGRYYTLKNGKGEHLAHVCLSSRKDLRNAVVAARGALGGWSSITAYNRSQILYRIAEMLEGRKEQFMAELINLGQTRAQAQKEVELSIDQLIYYSGWCDKYTQLFSTVNPVASSHFNFSAPEAMGVVGVIAPEDSALLGLVTVIAQVISGGNTCVVLASEKKATCAITLAEVIHTSDVPGGVVNILTGTRKELLDQFATHMDINAVVYAQQDKKELKSLEEQAIVNVKRIVLRGMKDWSDKTARDPYRILDTLEIKTTWHPIENTGSAGAGY